VRFDGYFPDVLQHPVTPEDWIAVREFIKNQRGETSAFDYVQYGVTPGDDPDQALQQLAPYEAAGVTWWIEGISPFDYGFDWTEPWTTEIVEQLELRVRQGPPGKY
jgi:hypothetical protein